MKKFVKQLRQTESANYIRELQMPHVVYFLKHYKKFYADPNIKPYLNKNVLTQQEKWKVSRAIENFFTKTNEIEHGWGEGHIRWWFWVDEDNEPEDKYKYIFN